ncbi:MAG: serine--tRNA ligase [Lentisphaerae bacterium]|jgi:seryl-tRNA synthetase|nr:serine--tRNA ligase [Lentisphaerota bacterium]
MLDIKRIRENPDELRDGLKRRYHDTAPVDALLACDQERRTLVTRVEELKSRRNAISREVGQKRKAGEDTTVLQNEVRAMGDTIAAMDQQIREVDERQSALLLSIPNIPCPTIPTGPDADSNRVVRIIGTPPEFDFTPLDHVALGERLGLFDLPRATRMTGSGFPLMLGAGARLQRALIQFMLDLHTEKHGYTEMLPPFVVNRDAMRGTGQLPKMEDDMYHCERDDLWLVPTAEVPVTNYYREEIIDRPLPIAFTAYTPCFRREAGSAGKETRGILRVHQFDKVEMVRFVDPATSYDELELLVSHAEDVLKTLDLHYRVIELCSGDISFSAAKCYDIELWAPGQKGWLEVSSCSNFEDFQARRANIRYRDADGKPRFVHTLNGSGVALPRLVIAILEQGQQADGSVRLPPAIVPYMNGVDRLTPA